MFVFKIFVVFSTFQLWVKYIILEQQECNFTSITLVPGSEKLKVAPVQQII